MSTPIHPLVDRILDGKLDAELLARRDAGDSYLTIGRWLDGEHDIQVTTETVRKWCQDAERKRAANLEAAS